MRHPIPFHHASGDDGLDLRSVRVLDQLDDFAILKFEEVQDFGAENFPARTVLDDKVGPYCSRIPLNHFAQDLARFEVEMVNELTEGRKQWLLPRYTSCQVQCAVVAHQVEQALGIKVATRPFTSPSPRAA